MFDDAELSPVPEPSFLTVEGHYFSPDWRRFLKPGRGGYPVLDIVHPQGAVMQLTALLPAKTCALQGFIGTVVYRDSAVEGETEPSFVLSGSTGNIRRNDKGETLGDGSFCFYPQWALGGRRLDYQPEVSGA